MNWLTEYRNSLKNVHAEEFLDVYFFRPIAFVIVKTFYSLPLTPNHYSLFSFIFGMTSAYYFHEGQFTIGAFFFFLFAVLDCCDGMQARMKKNGSEFGRFIDGLVDYTVNIAAYICLGIGTKHYMGSIETPFGTIAIWHLIIVAGLSKALHSITFDHYLMEYLSHSSGNAGFLQKELEEIKTKLEAAKKDPNVSPFRLFALWTYYGFSSLQKTDDQVAAIYDSKDYVVKNHYAIQMWGMIGPAWHIIFLIIAFLIQKPIWLFLYAIVFANIWMLIVYIYQQSVYKKIKIA